MRTVADELIEAFPASVTLTGGEPLLRDDLEILAGCLTGGGVRVGVATNGLLLDGARAGSLKRAGVGWIEVSLPSADRDLYMELTGCDGFGGAKRAMLEVRKAGMRLTVSRVITSVGMEDIGDTVRMAFALGAEALALNRFVPGGAGAAHRELVLGPDRLDEALSRASRAAEECPGMTVYAAIPVEGCVYPHRKYPGIRFGSCVCGRDKWAVGPDGGLRTCEQNPEVLGSLLLSGFSDLVKSPAVDSFRERCRGTECVSCRWREECGGGCRFLP